MHQRIGHLEDKIDQLRREGRHEEAEGPKTEVEEMQHGSGHDQSRQEPSHNSEHRASILNEAVDHMLEAVQKLRQAGMHELAEQLAREAEKFRGEIHK